MTKKLELNLEQLRSELAALNTSLLDTLKKRRHILKKIAQLKAETGSSSWDPQREFILFQDLLMNHEQEEVLLFATLLEKQAFGVMHDYPCWSEGEHLGMKTGSKWEKINPILLMQLNKPEYNRLSLKDNIKQKISKISL
ncbi:MAG: hypothetical protein CME62_17340 [Halobacteriovoraceae bacterium]|nr:hypothetical protein [Halobacteriovoraceae bacterium]|tara:strand:- start:6577 stop:6996 length:420 start_codon:yes stop_codon:yes gene_type:complete